MSSVVKNPQLNETWKKHTDLAQNSRSFYQKTSSFRLINLSCKNVNLMFTRHNSVEHLRQDYNEDFDE